ncbi:hypothetical protein NQ315_013360 [Exocentrus adspersus]|uniref:DOC domain-containing protein n=1 Tax=Exocentrus adspersus TaxID=1586481 RepID=A0AAV8VRE6_9CUCU|nr:hypothetical protein NQ315_013360 [Exocentrus adspersus]
MAVPGISCVTVVAKNTWKRTQKKRQINFHNKSDIQKKNCKNMSQRSSPAVLEPHIVMKKNAMFLLDLASSSESGIRRPRSSVNTMPSVSEDSSPPENTGPFDPLPPFQCLDALGANVCCNNASPFNYDLLNQHNYQENFMAYPSTSGQRPLSEVTVSDSDIDGNKGIRFHRSISMGTNGFPWSKSGYDGRVVMMRKRNNSSCEVNDGVSSLLCNPSNALQKLLRQKDSTSAVVKYDDNVSSDNSNLLERPVLRFILQQHDLDSLQFSMKRALRKAMCRAYAMQALNWLLRSVTQTICLHDLLWWFVTSLTPAEIDSETEEDNTILRKDDEQDIYICEHPLSDIAIAGEAVHPLPIAFHSLLQTIADIMVLLPMGSALQQIAVRCWGIRFTTADHKFLHRSQVFSNISKILSRSEEVEAFMTSLHETYSKTANSLTPSIECLKDLTPLVEIKASSRQAMVGSLTDNSTETFWESGDEDRNKTKIITIISPQGHYPTLACVHIDNCRDLGNKVSSITFFCGQNTDELIKLRTVEVETRLLGGWVNCPIMGKTIIQVHIFQICCQKKIYH